MPIAKTAIVIKTVVCATVPDSQESTGKELSIPTKYLTASRYLAKKPPITAQTAVRRLLAASVCLLALYDAPIAAAAVLDL